VLSGFYYCWPVASDAAVALTTQMLALSRQGINRAEAHRQAMMTMIDTGSSQNAHPAMWAPFVVVGEGGKSPPMDVKPIMRVG